MDGPEPTDLTAIFTVFFADYADSVLRGDVDRVTAAYESTYLECTPEASVAWQVDELYRTALEERSAMMRQLGLTAAETTIPAVTDLAPGHVGVDVGWALTFERPGASIISRFNVTYIVRAGLDLRIVMYVSHEDEAEVLQRDGVLPGEGEG